MSESNESGYTTLSFGDVVQRGTQVQGSDEIKWVPGADVILGPNDHNNLRSVSAFPVFATPEGDPYLVAPGTLGGTHVRVLCTLTLEEVRDLLRRGPKNDPLGPEYIVHTYTADEPRKSREYKFVRVGSTVLDACLAIASILSTDSEQE